MTAQRKYSRETFKAFTRETPQSREFCYFSDALHGRYSLRRHRSFSFLPFSGLDWKETLDRRRNEAVEDLKGILFFQLWLTHADFFSEKDEFNSLLLHAGGVVSFEVSFWNELSIP
jgi:hypothetical protein